MKSTLKQLADTGYAFDIETTLDHETIRLAGVGKSMTPYKDELKGWLSTINTHKRALITWNGTRFDWDLLGKVWGIKKSDYPDIYHIDGMLLAKILYPNAPSYKLSAFGERFKCKVEKGEVDYDHAPISELKEYLSKDLELTYEVVRKMLNLSLTYRKRPHSIKRALEMETKVAELCQKQVNKGVKFDVAKAQALVLEIEGEMSDIEDYLEMFLPSVKLPESKLHYPPKLQFKKDGTPSAQIHKYCAKYGFHVEDTGRHWVATDGRGLIFKLPLKKPIIVTEKLTLNNQAGLKDWLLSRGWKPTIWNTKRDPMTGKYVKTSPRFTAKLTKEPCPNLMAISAAGSAIGEKISKWLTLRSRKNVIASSKGTGWLPRAIDSPYHLLPSDADTLGANTARWTHRVIANIPRVSSVYGKEMRSLFKAREGKWWTGWDASSLEACMEAHYTYPYDPAYAEELMDGDVHTNNLEAIAPLKDRDHAKTFKYGITYGAQAAKVASILGVSKAEGEKWFEEFWKANSALSDLREDTAVECEHTKRICAIDGRDIGIRSPHSALNAKFQSAGAIVMKYAMIIADKAIKKKYGDAAHGLIRYHDEEIWECDTEEIAHEVGKIGVASIIAAGQYLKLNVALDAEYKVGKNWADVH